MTARARRPRFLLPSLLLILLPVCAPARARPGDRVAADGPAWRRYLANDTVTGRVVPCTDADKFCLDRGWLLYEPDGQCYLLGDRGPCAWNEVVRVDKHELLQGSGRVVAACAKLNLCGEYGRFKMAYDGSCLDFADVAEISLPQPGLYRLENVFGETELVCEGDYCPVNQQPFDISSQEQVRQGACAVPALRLTQLRQLPWAAAAVTPRAAVPCSDSERRCFLDGRLYLPERDLCFALWRRGPCAEGHWLLLDREEAVNGSGRLVGVCRALPCGGGGRVQAFADGACYTPQELCGAYTLALDAYGMAACTTASDNHLRWPTARDAGGLCRYPSPGDESPPPLTPPPRPPAPPACPDAQSGYCQRHVHRRPQPTP